MGNASQSLNGSCVLSLREAGVVGLENYQHTLFGGLPVIWDIPHDARPRFELTEDEAAMLEVSRLVALGDTRVQLDGSATRCSSTIL